MRNPFRLLPAACLSTVLLLAAASSDALAGKYNQVLSIGDKAPVWKDLPGTDGEKHALDDFKDKAFLVVVFTCNSCPYAVEYEDRIIAFVNDHAGKGSDVGVVAINVNKVEEDSLANMTARAEEKGFNFPYLFDESQTIAKEFGAGVTPEFFVLNRDREIVYMGALDDDTDAKKANVNYVEKAIAAARAGEKPETEETIAIGCRIRFERERRKK